MRWTSILSSGEPLQVNIPGNHDGLGYVSKIRNRMRIILVLGVLALAFGYFAFMAFDSATLFYLTVGELVERGASVEGESVRVSGKLVSGSFIRQDDSTIATFELTDGTHVLSAIHDGVLPDLFFNEHSEIILEGLYKSDGKFQSHHVTVKCPSKYIASG